MRRWIICVALILSLCATRAELDLSPVATPAPTPSTPPLPTAPLMDAMPFHADCAAALLMEAETGQIIFEMNADSQRPAASVTKVMTILLTLEALDAGRLSADEIVTVSRTAAGMGGSQVLLDVGERQSVGTLLKTMIVGSANDAAVALAEAMYGSEAVCVDRMNERAAQLGMAGTNFVNCTGLPAQGQHTTARDVAIMSRQLFSHPAYFDYAGIWLEDIYHEGGRTTQMVNTNKLIRMYDGCDGGKTGSTGEAGYCVSATARRGGMRLIAVVLGAPDGKSRFAIARQMFDYGFAGYRRYPVAQAGARVRGTLPVTGGQTDGVGLLLGSDLTLLIAKGDEQRIALSPELPDSLAAPVAAGEVVGSVAVLLDGRILARISVVAGESVAAKGLRPGLERVLRHWLILARAPS